MAKNNLPKTSRPATDALNNIGITELEHLTAYTEAELLKVHGVGPKAIRMLKEYMKEKGLNFKSK